LDVKKYYKISFSRKIIFFFNIITFSEKETRGYLEFQQSFFIKIMYKWIAGYFI